MPFRGFEGPAGTGKTYQLIAAVTAHCADRALQAHERILALSFMHGSRRRLDEQLRSIPTLRNRAVAMTIDSFARSIWNRWRTLAARHMIDIGDFDQTCNACGQLLECPQVAAWVSRSYPVVLVDEAQELSTPRLRIVRALEKAATLFVAADEFQCLDETLDTAPFIEWFGTGDIHRLDQVHRTGQQGLLEAGAALRMLSGPANGPGLRIKYEYPNVAPFAIGAALADSRGTTAMLYAPGGYRWTQELSARLAHGLRSQRYSIPPLTLVHEVRTDDHVRAVLEPFNGDPICRTEEVLQRLSAIRRSPPWLTQVHAAIRSASRCFGKGHWTTDELTALCERKAANHRAYVTDKPAGIPVMSIHQAKNRQFQHVVVLWPVGVPGSPEMQARLLYNAITRAQKSCRVFVRTEALLKGPPFRFG